MILSVLWFLLAALFFCCAVQMPPGISRSALVTLHVISVVNSLNGPNSSYSDIWVTFMIRAAMHSCSVLFIETRVVNISSGTFEDRLRSIFWACCNVRELPFASSDAIMRKRGGTFRVRAYFAVSKFARVLALWATNRSFDSSISWFLRGLEVNREDFAPAKQGLWPLLTYRDISLRTIVSFHWIWSTYYFLTSAHDVLAILFVSLLGWDLPSEWPPLFGNVAEAYSLRRFWGVFWQRLHIHTFMGYTPPFLRKVEVKQKRDIGWYYAVRNAAAALWIFLLSACCHVLVDLIVLRRNTIRPELVFFLSNYVVCLVETVVKSSFKERFRRYTRSCIWLRLVGYAWVSIFFFSTVPAWKYPLLYKP
ncbi:membrane bound O-acyl transferase family-domain-containing protein [Hypoxylon sp. FL0543]|nr:membrane bound O-acyl transferase family-domain-containing protein [Hypoxylon sp. FL0543]